MASLDSQHLLEHYRQERFRKLTLLAHGHTRDNIERFVVSLDGSRCVNYMACDATI